MEGGQTKSRSKESKEQMKRTRQPKWLYYIEKGNWGEGLSCLWDGEFRVRDGVCQPGGTCNAGTEECRENLAASVCFDVLNRCLSLRSNSKVIAKCSKSVQTTLHNLSYPYLQIVVTGRISHWEKNMARFPHSFTFPLLSAPV